MNYERGFVLKEKILESSEMNKSCEQNAKEKKWYSNIK